MMRGQQAVETIDPFLEALLAMQTSSDFHSAMSNFLKATEIIPVPTTISHDQIKPNCKYISHGELVETLQAMLNHV